MHYDRLATSMRLGIFLVLSQLPALSCAETSRATVRRACDAVSIDPTRLKSCFAVLVKEAQLSTTQTDEIDALIAQISADLRSFARATRANPMAAGKDIDETKALNATAENKLRQILTKRQWRTFSLGGEQR